MFGTSGPSIRPEVPGKKMTCEDPSGLPTTCEDSSGRPTTMKRLRPSTLYGESDQMRDDRIIASGYADRLVTQALEFTTKLPSERHRGVSKDAIFTQHMKAQIALSSHTSNALDGIAKALSDPLDRIADNFDSTLYSDLHSATEDIASAAESVASALNDISTSIDGVARTMGADV